MDYRPYPTVRRHARRYARTTPTPGTYWHPARPVPTDLPGWPTWPHPGTAPDHDPTPPLLIDDGTDIRIDGTDSTLIDIYPFEVTADLTSLPTDPHLLDPGLTSLRRVGPLALIPDTDNTYHSDVVDVVTLDNTQPPDKRHLGTLEFTDLETIGWRTIPALADIAAARGGHVLCSGWLDETTNTLLLSINPARLHDAARAYLATRTPSTPAKPAEDLHVHASTAAILTAASPPPTPPVPLDDLQLTLQSNSGHTRRRIVLTTPTHHIGHVYPDRQLRLADERHREDVLALLVARHIPARPIAPLPPGVPVTPPPHGLSVELIGRGSALVTVTPRPRWPLRSDPAAFNGKTKILWVEDQRLVPTISTFLARAGITIATVRTPDTPWTLDRDHTSRELTAHDELFEPFDTFDYTTEILNHRHILLPRPDHGLPLGNLERLIEWNPRGRRNLKATTQRALLAQEHLVTERARLFPAPTLTGGLAPCRLCGQQAATFTTPASTDPLTYCQVCLHHAIHGMLTNKTTTAAAVAEIAAREHQHTAPVPEQLAHLTPRTPLPAARVDDALLLRFAAHRHHPWTRILLAAKLVPEGIRTGRGTIVQASDGHLCLSLQEKTICEFLHHHHIPHDREPHYPADPHLNPRGNARADWLLADGTLVELWGMPDDPTYVQRMHTKQALAAKHHLQVLELTARDLPHLPARFAPWLPDGTAASIVDI